MIPIPSSPRGLQQGAPSWIVYPAQSPGIFPTVQAMEVGHIGLQKLTSTEGELLNYRSAEEDPGDLQGTPRDNGVKKVGSQLALAQRGGYAPWLRGPRLHRLVLVIKAKLDGSCMHRFVGPQTFRS